MDESVMATNDNGEYKWDPSYFRDLVSASGMSLESVADGCGINKQSIFNYARLDRNPGLENLVKIADFFGVPLDYLVGRCDKETAESILHDYASHFMEMRRAPYEAYLIGRRHINRNEMKYGRYEAPWPYDLLDDIVAPYVNNPHREEDEFWTDVLNEEQEAGLRMVIDSLSEREREFVFLYYRDGMSLDAIGKERGITRERVRQIVAKAVRKMRHPSRRRLIECGPHFVAEESEYKRRREDLDRKTAILDEEEEKLVERLKKVSEARLCLQANGLWYQGLTADAPAPNAEPASKYSLYRPITTMPLEAMDLSVRSYNCLKRKELHTLGLVMEVARTGGLVNVRNLGRKSLTEILNRIRVITGDDYSALYGVTLYV